MGRGSGEEELEGRTTWDVGRSLILEGLWAPPWGLSSTWTLPWAPMAVRWELDGRSREAAMDPLEVEVQTTTAASSRPQTSGRPVSRASRR
jgi:hypothetical protein